MADLAIGTTGADRLVNSACRSLRAPRRHLNAMSTARRSGPTREGTTEGRARKLARAYFSLRTASVGAIAIHREHLPLSSESHIAGVGSPVPDNPIRDAILAAMAAHPSFHAHPSETKTGGTKYVAAFSARNGRALAFDKAVASKQPVWMVDEPAVRALLETLRVSFDYYPADRGRNSNLSKFSEFEARSLLRAFPSTQAEAIEIAEGVAGL